MPKTNTAFQADSTIMIQGTASDAGKSMLVTALCRCLYRRGAKVVPFKPQNMALNSAVTADGGEIGRAQAVQAQAAGVAPHVDMNPILLKPSTDTGAQVIVHGKAIGDMQAAPYHEYKTTAMNAVLASHQRLIEQYECVVVEGAGSPAEINLRDRDIANMGFAEDVDCPVILIADIDKGGVFAQIIGTLELLSETERARIVGFVINRFRGDIKLLESGLDWLEEKTQKPVLGVLPYLHNLQIAAEDAIDVEQVKSQAVVRIVVPVFSRISNHTDFDMLRVHPQIELLFAPQGSPLPKCDLIILPGSKNVRADLTLLREQGWDGDLAQHLRYGGKVLGICGGYQMLGRIINDPDGIEGPAGSSDGLGYLAVETVLQRQKQLTQDSGHLNLSGKTSAISGYQIHVGKSKKDDHCQYFAKLSNGEEDGCISEDNQIAGTYLHGLFDSPEIIQEVLFWSGFKVDLVDDYHSLQEREINRIADCCEQYLDWDKLIPFLGEKNIVK